MKTNIQINDKFKSKNGLIGLVKNFNGVPMLEVKNALGRVTQTISLKKVDLTKFEKIEPKKESA